MSESSRSSSGGTDTLGLLCIAFIVLKLCHVIDWSWWWVMAPVWGTIVALLLVLLIWFIIFVFSKEKPRHIKFQERLKEMQEKRKA